MAVMLLGFFGASSADSVSARPSPKNVRTSAPVLEENAARAAGLSAAEAKDASKLYTTKCMRCHKSYEPAAYSQAQWDSWMAKMQKKAKLTPEQSSLLCQYLQAYRAASPVVKTNSVGTPPP